MLTRMHVYKHVKNTDVAIQPLRIISIPKGLKVKIQWYSISLRRDKDGNLEEYVWPMGFIETVTITKDQIPNWKLFRRYQEL